MIRTVLTDAQWAVIAPHCLGRECDPGRTGPDPRRFVEAVLWISRTGCPWRDLPEEFGRWNMALLHGSDNSRKPPLPVIQAMRFV